VVARNRILTDVGSSGYRTEPVPTSGQSRRHLVLSRSEDCALLSGPRVCGSPVPAVRLQQAHGDLALAASLRAKGCPIPRSSQHHGRRRVPGPLALLVDYGRVGPLGAHLLHRCISLWMTTGNLVEHALDLSKAWSYSSASRSSADCCFYFTSGQEVEPDQLSVMLLCVGGCQTPYRSAIALRTSSPTITTTQGPYPNEGHASLASQ
jgi:hypothetical protein